MILTTFRIEIQAGCEDRIPGEILNAFQRLSQSIALPPDLPETIAPELARIYCRQCRQPGWGSIFIRVLVPLQNRNLPGINGFGEDTQPGFQTTDNAWGFFVVDWKESAEAPGSINLDVYIFEE